MTPRRSVLTSWLKPNIDVALLLVFGVCYSAVAITTLITITFALVVHQNWLGEFVGFGLKMAFWAVFNFSLAHLLWENRELKRALRMVGLR